MTYIRPIGQFVFQRTMIVYVMHSTPAVVSSNRGRYISGNYPLLKHAFIGIVNTTNVHRLQCLHRFKVLHLYVCL